MRFFDIILKKKLKCKFYCCSHSPIFYRNKKNNNAYCIKNIHFFLHYAHKFKNYIYDFVQSMRIFYRHLVHTKVKIVITFQKYNLITLSFTFITSENEIIINQHIFYYYGQSKNIVCTVKTSCSIKKTRNFLIISRLYNTTLHGQNPVQIRYNFTFHFYEQFLKENW